MCIRDRLVTVGQQVTGMLDEQPFLGGDVLSPAAPFAKGLWEPRRVADLPGVLTRAIRLARTPPYGPVVVSLPMDVLVTAAPAAAHVSAGWGRAAAPDAPEIAALALRLRQADAPVLLVGDGVAHAGVADRVVTLAERLGAPMLGEPWASRVAVHANHPTGSSPIVHSSARGPGPRRVRSSSNRGSGTRRRSHRAYPSYW